MFRLPHCFSQDLYRALFIHTKGVCFIKRNQFSVSYFTHSTFFKPFFFQMPCINLQRAMISIRNLLLSCCDLRVSLLSPDEVSIVDLLDILVLVSFSRQKPWSFTGAFHGSISPTKVDFLTVLWSPSKESLVTSESMC